MISSDPKLPIELSAIVALLSALNPRITKIKPTKSSRGRNRLGFERDNRFFTKLASFGASYKFFFARLIFYGYPRH